MVPCRVTCLGAFIITVVAKGKALQERKCGTGSASVFNKDKNGRCMTMLHDADHDKYDIYNGVDFHSCCEDEEVREGSNATLIFYTDLYFQLMNNTLLEVIRDRDNEHKFRDCIWQYKVLCWNKKGKIETFLDWVKEHVFKWNVSKENSAGNNYRFDCSPICTLILSIPNVTSSHTGKYALSHSLVSIQEPCLLRVRNDFHSCCEDEEVRKGSNATLIFYTDFNFNSMNNTLLEVTRDTVNNSREPVFQWEVSTEHSIGDDYVFDCSPNCTLKLSIPNVTSSHEGKYAMSHIKVPNPVPCQLRIRNDGQNNRTSSYKFRIPANYSEATPDPDSLVGSGDTSDYKVPTIIALSVTLGIFSLMTIVLCTAKKNRCVCFKERPNQTFENGHELLELNSTLSEKEDFIKEEIENV